MTTSFLLVRDSSILESVRAYQATKLEKSALNLIKKPDSRGRARRALTKQVISSFVGPKFTSHFTFKIVQADEGNDNCLFCSAISASDADQIEAT